MPSLLRQTSGKHAVHSALKPARTPSLPFPATWCHHAGVVLADPMCGSGTFLIEAALIATHTAPGLARKQWPFQLWPEFDARRFKACLDDAIEARQPWNGHLLGNDHHAGALSLART